MTGYYFVKYLSDTVALPEYITIHGQIFKEGKLTVIYKYLRVMKDKTNCYWEPKTSIYCICIHIYNNKFLFRCASSYRCDRYTNKGLK